MSNGTGIRIRMHGGNAHICPLNPFLLIQALAHSWDLFWNYMPNAVRNYGQ